jgi:hypothetical protein
MFVEDAKPVSESMISSNCKRQRVPHSSIKLTRTALKPSAGSGQGCDQRTPSTGRPAHGTALLPAEFHMIRSHECMQTQPRVPALLHPAP